MFPHEFGWVLCVAGQGLAQLLALRGIGLCPQRIAQRHGDVAQPAFMPDAPDRAALGAAQEFTFALRKQLDQGDTGQAFARIEIGQR
jgi:hypothetical protein